MVESKYSYNHIAPYATYAPWNQNEEFCKLTHVIVEYTLVDMYRQWELWKLVEQVSKLSSGDILEVGTYKGGTGTMIAKQASVSCPEAKVYLCDTFQGIVKCGENEISTRVNGQHVADIEDVVELILKMSLTNIEILTGIFPEDTQHLIPQDTVFRLCHIDVDVYQSAKDIMDWVWPRLLVHGIVVFDDYGFTNCDGITKLVEEMMLMDDRMYIHNLNGHAIIIKLR
jgi:O-methyltransferase